MIWNKYVALLINYHYHHQDNALINEIAAFRLSSNPRNTIANISACTCNLIKYVRRAVENMRFKLNVMFALFLGQQYDTLMNGLTKDKVEATTMCVNFTEINRIPFRKNNFWN